MSDQFIVATMLDGTLNVSAAGPFRSEEKAMAAAQKIEEAGAWTELAEAPTIIAQVIRLQSVADLVEGARR